MLAIEKRFGGSANSQPQRDSEPEIRGFSIVP